MRKKESMLMRKLTLLALTIVLILVSCDDKPMEETNPFIGTWENNNGYRTVFTKTVATGYYRPNGDIYWTGTYTYDDTHITVQLDQEVSAQEMVEGWGSTETIPYRFEGDVLRFNHTVLLTKKKD